MSANWEYKLPQFDREHLQKISSLMVKSKTKPRWPLTPLLSTLCWKSWGVQKDKKKKEKVYTLRSVRNRIISVQMTWLSMYKTRKNQQNKNLLKIRNEYSKNIRHKVIYKSCFVIYRNEQLSFKFEKKIPFRIPRKWNS